ncbi:ComEC family competence protein [Nocardia sp. CDC159]|uniref:ComEC family competence protein n=1 Tax=Nocardia pulmonis TaxID=2951408 RepID=A0A9X2E5Y2_9NOCA|nr:MULTISPECIES: ComEC/Rec2 family competence protein [Nocardia]MCM6773703.1 ComEC family competence protein [Nocardia pulmonis]MCM6786590.1 ComEC family competence protein [Nocardia sp. CDC159]
MCGTGERCHGRYVSGASSAEEGRDPIAQPQAWDLRLVPAAVLCWGATIAAIVGGWRIGLAVAGLLVAAGIGLGCWVIRRGWSSHGRSERLGFSRAIAMALLAALLAGAGFAVAAAWRQYLVDTHPLRTLAEGSSTTFLAVPTDDPKPLRAKSFGGRQWLLRAELREYRRGAATLRAGGAVLVIVPEEGWSTLLPGQTVRFRARVDRPWRQDLTVAVLRAQGPPLAVGDAPWWQRAAGSLRADLAEAADRALPPDAAGLLPGMVVGDVSRLPDHVREDFVEIDLAHLVAVSGTNVSIVLAAVLISTRACTVDLRVGAALAALALLAFVIIARPSPSVLRAAVMGAVAIGALVTGRRKQALSALCAAVIGLLAYSPRLALDPGFALSVSATAGLVLLAPDWSRRLRARGWPRPLAEASAVASAAFLLTAPMIVGLTGHLAPVAILANILVEPVIAPITIVGAVAAVVSCLWMPAAVLLLHLTGPPLAWLLTVAERGAALNVSLSLPTGLTGGLLVAAIISALLAVDRAVRRPERHDDAAESSPTNPTEGDIGCHRPCRSSTTGANCSRKR